MKKLLSITLSAVLSLSLFAACGSSDSASTPDSTPSAAPTPVETVATEAHPQESYEIISKSATTWVDSIGTTWVQTIIEVENTGNVNLYMNSCSYDLENDSGSLVAAHSLVSAYPQILAPGEKGVIYNETTLDAPVDGDLSVLPHEDIESATVDMIRYPISDFSISAGQYMGINMKGRVENTTSEELTFVYVVAILYNSDGSCIGTNFTIIDKIKAGDKVGFDADTFSMPDSITIDDVASYEVFAYPMQFQF